MNSTFLKITVRAGLGKTAVESCLLSDQPVHFFVQLSEKAEFAGPATVSNAGSPVETVFFCSVHSQDLRLCKEKSDHVVFGALITQEHS